MTETSPSEKLKSAAERALAWDRLYVQIIAALNHNAKMIDDMRMRFDSATNNFCSYEDDIRKIKQRQQHIREAIDFLCEENRKVANETYNIKENVTMLGFLQTVVFGAVVIVAIMGFVTATSIYQNTKKIQQQIEAKL
jgi:hypothetical protein